MDLHTFFHVALHPQRQDGLLGTGTEWEGDERVRARPRKPSEKNPERLWTATRTMEVLRWCPLTIAQRLVHCAMSLMGLNVLGCRPDISGTTGYGPT